MKMNFLMILIVSAFLSNSCEEDNEFETVSHEVYKINLVTKGGCFGYSVTDTLEILPITRPQSTTMYIEDGYGIVEFSKEYYCYAQDSINLTGNVLKLFLRPINNSNQDCNCIYSWIVKLDIIENKGLKVLYYEYENGSFRQKQEMYNHVL